MSDRLEELAHRFVCPPLTVATVQDAVRIKSLLALLRQVDAENVSKTIYLSLLLLASCDYKPGPLTPHYPGASSGSDRFTVELVQVFADDLAYGHTRGVYVLRDSTTGQEYVGISGVGISELRSHRVGKARVSDER